MSAVKCFCGGDGKYVDYNCGESFYVQCPHCQGTGQKRCGCKEVSLVCAKYGRGHEIVEPARRRNDLREEVLRDEEDVHWMFMD